MSYVGTLELFKVGIGPSSSHTVGPMTAAAAFTRELKNGDYLNRLDSLRIGLYGSLGATGAGHGTIPALIRGLAQDRPETCDPNVVASAYEMALASGCITVADRTILFKAEDISHHPLTRLDRHSNGMVFTAYDSVGTAIHTACYFSIGGGFIERDGGEDVETPPSDSSKDIEVPHPFMFASELITEAETTGKSIAEIVTDNDAAVHGRMAVEDHLRLVWTAMKSCIEKGLTSQGWLPGNLKVRRRAHEIAHKLQNSESSTDLSAEWLQVFAIAVNEENAGGGRVVTAPTNGAAGIIPAVALWVQRFHNVSDFSIERVFLPTAAAIGRLYKLNASISGAEAGCQGEVGSACSMAAAGVTAVMGGTAAQIENAAEIAMEHNLGLTCDPVGGYVQLPCIERNAIAAGTAVGAMRLALLGDGSHKISLDTVIETMRQTGVDMSDKYKETSMGGLAVNVVEC